MESCRKRVQKILQPALADRISAAPGQAGWKLEVDPDMDDGQCLLFHYPGEFAPTEAGYMRPVVKNDHGTTRLTNSIRWATVRDRQTNSEELKPTKQATAREL